MEMATLAVFAALVLAAFLGPLARVAFADGVSPIALAFLRSALGGALFALEALARGQLRMDGRAALRSAAFGALILPLLYLSYLCSVRVGGAATAAVLLYSAPAWVIAFGWLTGRPFRTRGVAAVGLAVAGVALVARTGGPLGLGSLALVLGLVSGLAYAAYYVAYARLLANNQSGAAVLGVALPVAALVLLPAAQFVIPTRRAALAVVAISAASTYGAYRLHGLALRHLPPGRVALLGAAEPVLAAVIGRVFWGEPIGATFWWGAALILSSVLITQPGEL